MLEQRYYEVKAYQQEILDESARQRLARLGRTPEHPSHRWLSTLQHAIAGLRSEERLRGHLPRSRPPTAHPAH